MAAATENAPGRTQTYEGNHAVTYCNVTWDNSNTFATGYAGILSAVFTPTTNASFGITKSGGTVTLVSGGALTGDLKVISDGGA